VPTHHTARTLTARHPPLIAGQRVEAAAERAEYKSRRAVARRYCLVYKNRSARQA